MPFAGHDWKHNGSSMSPCQAFGGVYLRDSALRHCHVFLQEVRSLDDSKEAALTAAVVSELSDAMRGILEVGAPTFTPSPRRQKLAAFGRITSS